MTLRYEYWYGALYPKDGIIPHKFSLHTSARSDESGAARLAYLELLKRALIGATALFSNVQLIDCPQGFGKNLNPRDSGVLINGGYERLINMHSLLDKVRLEHIKGDYVECGVWRGGSALFMAAYAKLYGQVDRKTWLFDSFEGVPPGNSSERWRNNNGELIDRGWEKDNLAVALEDVQRHFSQYDLAGSSIIFVKGWFSKTLPVSQVESIAILRVDGDLYSSTYLVHPTLWVSMDETSVSLSPEATHANGQAIISAHAGDEGQTLHSKGLPRSRLVYACNGAGQLLPSMVVCGGRAKLPDDFPRVDLLAEAPRQSEGEGDADVPPNVVDAEGVPLKTHWTANKRAILNTELLIEWADECLSRRCVLADLAPSVPRFYCTTASKRTSRWLSSSIV